ncbi:hypothetical protein [Rhizobium ruizarguesonis]|uniref:hypothetical protein n=1 Tax=Rhizobium ruizarguesonis TaxID=2081791 RepID=UPI0010315C09|nr:hypothetical protein [Rhizobium ruizarguesonis]TBB81033.1 hypothetical protein ELH38_33630 [Rhizobium ruizarguesonis]TBC40046.1 hypothetical protein ELH29_33670 [Rhizobium ruizarguesonis]
MKTGNERNPAPSEMEKAFGLTLDELMESRNAAWAFLDNERVREAFQILETASPGATDQCYNMLVARSFSGAFGTAGKALAVYASQDGGLTSGSRWSTILRKVMVEPPTHADTADWWVLFSALNASVEFQMTQLGAPKMEQRLTGEFLSELKHAGLRWGGLLAPMLKRRGASMAFHQIDLERLGGEQATGGDFALVLDFDGLTGLPSEPPQGHRIVPLIFQAKRFIRPKADVSQSHKTRGLQKSYLRTNPAASAYIFYENGDMALPAPLPVLVKPIANVHHEKATNVFADTADFASYLYRASVDPTFAPRAESVEEALSMIYARARPGQLSSLLVASGSPNARKRYEAAVAHFAATYGPDLEGDKQSGED